MGSQIRLTQLTTIRLLVLSAVAFGLATQTQAAGMTEMHMVWISRVGENHYKIVDGLGTGNLSIKTENCASPAARLAVILAVRTFENTGAVWFLSADKRAEFFDNSCRVTAIMFNDKRLTKDVILSSNSASGIIDLRDFPDAPGSK